MGAYFWGYFITTLPGGVLSELFGGRRVVGYALGFSGLLTALTPLVAEWSFWAVYVMRVATGLLGVCTHGILFLHHFVINLILLNSFANVFYALGCFFPCVAHSSVKMGTAR